MTTYAVPSWWQVAGFEATLAPQVRTFNSPYGGAGQALDLLGERWEFGVELPGCKRSAAAQQEAFFNALRGPAHLVSLYHFARPQPQGTARGSFTLSATMAQGASTMALAGLRASPNLMPYGEFAMDADMDGISDGWVSYTAGSFGAQSFDRIDGYQRIFATLLGPAVGDRVGLQGPTTPAVAGLPYTLAADLNSSGAGHKAWLYLAFFNASAGFVGEAFSEVDVTTSWTRSSVTGTAPAGTATVVPYVWMTKGATDLRALWVRKAQLEQAAAASAPAGFATLLAGDMLGHNSEQLFQVLEDATANDAGAVTVTLANRARKAIASGQAINWNKPTTTMRLADGAGVPRVYTVGDYSPGLSLRFVETWA